MEHQIKTVRVYELDPDMKGERILVDRLWPRGIRKEALIPFIWSKEMAPTKELRTWFNHEPEKYQTFKERYLRELDENPEGKTFKEWVRQLLKDNDVLLMYGAKNKKYNHAVVLAEWLKTQ